MEKEELITLTADIVSAHVASNQVSVNDVPTLVQKVFEALSSLGTPATDEPVEKTPVVSVRASVRPDYIVCMECGKKQRTLKRHLMSAHNMTPAEYRKDYGLPDSYPMTAPNYSEQRRSMAHSIGLGRKKAEGAAGETAAPERKKGRAGPKKQA
ncbi:MAG TPA: MucR family transcriptional regulator [Allosphingosinicella sp.]|nr:MucR family transcriptional regulator [Allosphingosinicella sp.]